MAAPDGTLKPGIDSDPLQLVPQVPASWRRIGGIALAGVSLAFVNFLVPVRGDLSHSVEEASCSGVLLWSGLYYFLGMIVVCMVRAYLVPGIWLGWWAAWIALSVPVTTMLTFRGSHNGVGPQQNLHLNFLVFEAFDVGMFLMMVRHAANPNTFAGYSFPTPSRFNQLPKGDRFKIVGMAWIIARAVDCFYFGCIALTLGFKNVSSQLQPFLYLLFRTCFPLLNFVQRRVAKRISRLGASPGVDNAECQSFAVHTLYFVFYHELFEEVKGWSPLLKTIAMHAAIEFANFSLRLHPRIFRIQHSILRSCPLYSSRDKGVSEAHEDFVRKQSIAYGNRVLLSVMSLPFMIAVSLFLHYGYNNGVFGARVTNEVFATTLSHFGVALAAELFTYLVIQLWNTGRFIDQSFAIPWRVFLQSPAHQVWVVVMFAHVMADTYSTRMDASAKC